MFFSKIEGFDKTDAINCRNSNTLSLLSHNFYLLKRYKLTDDVLSVCVTGKLLFYLCIFCFGFFFICEMILPEIITRVEKQ